MKRRFYLLGPACALIFGALACAKQASPVTTPSATAQLADRTEIHAISTLTLSDAQFLKGDEAGAKPATVTGELRIAQGTGRLPVVVMLHGSGGISAGTETWVSQFNRMGVSTFVIDGFTGRGLTTVNTNQALLGRLNQTLDAYRALAVLAANSRVDTSRIVLMGFSRGGQATLYAALTRFQRMWNKSGVSIAGYVALYPDCSTTFVNDDDLVARPVRLFHGEADDYDFVSACASFVDRLHAAHRDVTLTKYAGASHLFDNPLFSVTPTVRQDAQTVRNCVIIEDPIGQLIDAKTRKPFTYDDPCVERNPHVAYNPDATRAVHAAVGEFVKTIFKLK